MTRIRVVGFVPNVSVWLYSTPCNSLTRLIHQTRITQKQGENEMPVKAPKPLELDHPGITEACVKLLQAKEIKSQMEKIEEEQKEAIKMVLEEYPDTKKFLLPGHTIDWRVTKTIIQKKVRSFLVKANVDPELLQAADEEAKTEGEPWLKIDRRK